MQDKVTNRVRNLRESRGLSQIALAQTVGLTRQSIHAIENGKAIPAVDIALRLSTALDCPVEALFGGLETAHSLTVEPVGRHRAGRVALAHISGRWLSYPLDRDGIFRAADAIALRKAGALMEVEPLRRTSEARENLIVIGCAPALGLLADRLNAHAGAGRFLWLARSSATALEALARRQAHLAGIHLVDAKSGEANVPYVRRHVRDRAVVLITLARWEAGIVLASGNPKDIIDVSGLARKGVRLVAREPGSGARMLLERELKRADLPVRIAAEASAHASGHLEVAQAIAMGAADAGIATRDAAMAFELAFVPLAEERYDLVVPRDELDDARVSRWFDAMTAAPFRREISSLGYDAAHAGERVAEIVAA
jgi:molybdate-binding protein/DNA-binding XRE family transcriptional regulator